jgi:hypothetical protein
MSAAGRALGRHVGRGRRGRARARQPRAVQRRIQAPVRREPLRDAVRGARGRGPAAPPAATPALNVTSAGTHEQQLRRQRHPGPTARSSPRRTGRRARPRRIAQIAIARARTMVPVQKWQRTVHERQDKRAAGLVAVASSPEPMVEARSAIELGRVAAVGHGGASWSPQMRHSGSSRRRDWTWATGTGGAHTPNAMQGPASTSPPKAPIRHWHQT